MREGSHIVSEDQVLLSTMQSAHSPSPSLQGSTEASVALVAAVFILLEPSAQCNTKDRQVSV